MVNFDELETYLDRDGDMPVAYGVSFRSAKPCATLHFVRTDDRSVHMYVFVDENHLPVGMALVHPPTPCVEYATGSLDEAGVRKRVLDLYGFLSQLAFASKVQDRNERVEKLLRRAADAAKELEAAKYREAA